MRRKGILQEGLKLIACATMLLDHIGAVFCSGMELRVAGRLAFPIYCFLLAEGMERTRNPWKYGLRLAAGAVLSEIPFDLLFFGEVTWAHQSVMVTLLLGFLMLMGMKKVGSVWAKCLVAVPAAVAAELLGTDYGGFGIMAIALFAVTRERPDRLLIQTLGQLMLWWLMGSYSLNLGLIRVPIQMFAVLSMIPISLYSGRKATSSRAVQWGFYLFYPLHLTVLLLL